jgi:23S rRNA (guanosine2251-2'-O)-methyltransferase
MGATFKIFECENPGCRFRCPQTPTDRILAVCPVCGSSGTSVEYDFPDDEPGNLPPNSNLPQVEVLLDNLRSIYNVGSIFRSSDGTGIRHLYLGGYTPTPEHPKLKKTGLGSEWTVPWESVRNGLELVNTKKSEGFQIWSLERAAAAISIFDSSSVYSEKPILLVVGNERTGIDPEILRLSDRVVFIPMSGMKRSLNVATAFGVAAFALTRNG